MADSHVAARSNDHRHACRKPFDLQHRGRCRRVLARFIFAISCRPSGYSSHCLTIQPVKAIVKRMLEYHSIDSSFRALSDATRRAIFERLSRGPASSSDLAKPFDISLAAVVQHLQVLESSGLIQSEKVGRVRTCRVNPNALARLSDWVTERRSLVERRLDRLGQLLDAEDETPDHPNKQTER
jgi:DNA-binding transcriptional ArsR family regulator